METINHSALYNEAKQYTNTVKGLFKKKKFNNQTIANIACLAAEEFMVAYMAKNGQMPHHHSLDALIDDVAKIKKDLPLSMTKEVLFLEEFQNLCVIENIGMKVPTDAEMERIINTLVGLDVTLFP